MYITDFTYDGVTLSSKGYVVCSFNGGGGLETIGNGSVISFSTTPILKGALHTLADAKYDEVLTSTFSICKNPCTNSYDMNFTVSEERQLMRWLNQKEYKKLYVNATGYSDIYFEGSFNVSRIENAGQIVGFELSFTSNRPFGVRDAITFNSSIVTANGSFSISDSSDEVGYIYPSSVVIKVKSDGNLTINNSIEPNRNVVIKNCKANEVITMKHPTIQSSDSTHAINDDFNYNFFRLANTLESSTNLITSSLPCDISISYNPIRKVGL